mmetsp:Transcript_29428/g.41298  ORF Transcript_29428/g.41298 Transcript_29428/m.41298 type:complete len:227 (-) Transcript_29428:341-1021(-)
MYDSESTNHMQIYTSRSVSCQCTNPYKAIFKGCFVSKIKIRILKSSPSNATNQPTVIGDCAVLPWDFSFCTPLAIACLPATGYLVGKGSKRHTFGFQLLQPCRDSTISHIALIVFIQGEAHELPILHTFRFLKGIARCIHISHHLGTCCLKGIMKFFNAITKIITIGLRVTTTKNSYNLATKIILFNGFQVIIPSCTRSIFICSSVPGWTTCDYTVQVCKIFPIII